MNPKKFKPGQDQSIAAKRKAAMTRLRERWEKENPDEEWEPEMEPIITPMLKSVDGGIPHVLDALRAHDDDDARAFVEVYEQCSAGDVRNLSLESMAFAAGIGSLRLAEIAQTAIFLFDGMKTKMLLASGLPAIVSQSIKMAKTPRGLHDREMMLKAGGILPLPKGNQIHIQNLNSGEREDEAPKRPLWREPEDRLREIHDLTEPKRLPSPDAHPVVAGGRLDRFQDETIHIVQGE